jgi:hypothetical protein
MAYPLMQEMEPSLERQFLIFKKIMIKKFTIAFKNNFVKALYVP